MRTGCAPEGNERRPAAEIRWCDLATGNIGNAYLGHGLADLYLRMVEKIYPDDEDDETPRPTLAGSPY